MSVVESDDDLGLNEFEANSPEKTIMSPAQLNKRKTLILERQRTLSRKDENMIQQ